VKRSALTWLALWLLVATAVAVGVLVGSLLATTVSASRPAQQADSPQLSGEMTTERRHVQLPSPDFAGRTGQPDSHPGAPTAGPVPGRITPSPSVTGSGPETAERPAAAASLRGIATWFNSPAGVSAAGPDLRAALGPGWRGTTVTVCAGDRCVATVLGDWCACGPRPGGPTVIDLHADIFARLARLSRGVLPIEVSW
jgi:hypothetical protein